MNVILTRQESIAILAALRYYRDEATHYADDDYQQPGLKPDCLYYKYITSAITEIEAQL